MTKIMPAAPTVFFDHFRNVLKRQGKAAARTESTRLSGPGRDELFYVPFEHLNCEAKLVIVGITPGPNQIELAYEEARNRIGTGLSDSQILALVKKNGAFGGPAMRPNLLKMLRAFGFADLLRIPDENDLWGRSSVLLHATSVVPHAAFTRGKPFAGSFEEVQCSPVFNRSFERDFAAPLALISAEARYIALGPTPLDALDWCATRGLIRSDQVLGAFAHPSSQAGSQVDVYLGVKKKDQLNLKDPVRKRVDWLLSAAARMRASLQELRDGRICIA